MAKTCIPLLPFTMTTAAAIPQKRFVGYDGNLCVANAKAAGVSMYAADAANEQITLEGKGIAVVMSAGAITKGDPVVSSGTGADAGKAATATTMSATQSGSTAESTVETGSTDVTSTAANGSGIVTTTVTDGDITLAGSVLPQAINGYALDTTSGADEEVRVLLV